MTIVLRAAIAVLSLASIGSAYAGEAERTSGTIGSAETTTVIAQAQVGDVPSVATAQSGHAVEAQETQPSRRIWLFPPIGNYLPR